MRMLKLLPALLLLSGCASWNEGTPGDPYEKLNRRIWKIDQGLDKAIAKPAAKGYIAIVPAFLRHGLHNMLANVEEPFSAGNSVLQAKPKRALNSVARFLINSTVGLAGFTDQASKMGLKPTPRGSGTDLRGMGRQEVELSGAAAVRPVDDPRRDRHARRALGRPVSRRHPRPSQHRRGHRHHRVRVRRRARQPDRDRRGLAPRKQCRQLCGGALGLSPAPQRRDRRPGRCRGAVRAATTPRSTPHSTNSGRRTAKVRPRRATGATPPPTLAPDQANTAPQTTTPQTRLSGSPPGLVARCATSR